MSDSGRNSKGGISAEISFGDVGKPAGNNIENNRLDTRSAIGGNLINTSVEDGKGKKKANNATRISATSGALSRYPYKESVLV